MIRNIHNLDEFSTLKKEQEFFFLVFYTDSSENSKKTLSLLKDIHSEYKDVPGYAVNASQVKDIHPVLNVNSVPTVLAFKNGKIVKNIQGLQTKDHYEMLFYDSPAAATGDGQEKQHSVVVYSTPSCSWCNRLKQHLRKKRVRFRDVDVSRDQRAAQSLMERTGQTGVPQTEIDGQWIVGFDQSRIDRLLGLAR